MHANFGGFFFAPIRFGGFYMRYTKPALTFEQQADKLLQRGLIADRDTLIERLSVVSYYRLTGYWHIFRQPDPIQNDQFLDDFQPGTNFDEIWNRYAFDRRLRLAVMDAIERVEIVVRTTLAYHHAHSYGPFGYTTEPSSLPNLKKEKQIRFLSSVLNESGRSKDTFVVHFDRKYASHHFYLPIWMAVEIMSFGSVFTMYKGCSSQIRQAVAIRFGEDDKVFETWLLTLNTIRNICAHHGRLWNRELGTKPRIPRKRKFPDWHTPVEVGNARMFGVLTICKWSLDRIAPQSQWVNRLRTLLIEYPDIPLISMGFPDNWQASAIWRAPANISDKVVAKAKRTEGAD
jgi:abortive infection bacteriophage resistance protein